MADEKKTIEVKGLGTVEVVAEPTPAQTVDGKERPAKPGVMRMSEGELMKFYESHGVPNPKTVLKAVNTARREFGVAAAEALAPKVIETGSDWELRAGLGENRLVAGIDAERTIRNVRTGEKTTKYGTFWMKASAPNPIADDRFPTLQKDIEAAMKEKAGLK